MNDVIILKKVSDELYQLLNRPYYFTKNEVLCCEEREIDRFDNVIVLVHSNEHPPLHFHVITTNQDTKYKVFLDNDYNITEFKRTAGKPFSKRLLKNIQHWYEEQNGREMVVEELMLIGLITN